MKLRTIVTAVTLMAGSQAFAVNYSNEVLAIGVGARALGMGGAYVALADDSTAVYWNPAGLAKVANFEVSAVQQGKSYAGLNEVGSQYIFASGAMRLGGAGALGVSFMRFGVDGIEQTKAGATPTDPPIEIGKFSTQDFGLLVAWGNSWHKSISTGLTLKYLAGGTNGIQAQPGGALGDAQYSYTGMDLGIMVNFGGMTKSLDGLSLGLNLQDLANTGTTWRNTPTDPTDKVDLNPKVGLAYTPQFQFLKEGNSQVTLAIDADPKYGSNMLMHYGGEFWYKDTLGFRGGIRQFMGGLQNIEGTLGASFKLYILEVDYAFINYELTPIHYLSLSVKF